MSCTQTRPLPLPAILFRGLLSMRLPWQYGCHWLGDSAAPAFHHASTPQIGGASACLHAMGTSPPAAICGLGGHGIELEALYQRSNDRAAPGRPPLAAEVVSTWFGRSVTLSIQWDNWLISI